MGFFRLEVLKDFLSFLTDMKDTFYEKHIIKRSIKRKL